MIRKTPISAWMDKTGAGRSRYFAVARSFAGDPKDRRACLTRFGFASAAWRFSAIADELSHVFDMLPGESGDFSLAHITGLRPATDCMAQFV